MESLYIVCILVLATIAWSLSKFNAYKKKLSKLLILAQHPVIIKQMDDMETIGNIVQVTDTELSKVKQIWLPLCYGCVIFLGMLAFMIDAGPDFPSTFAAFTSFTIAGLLAGTFGMNFNPPWLLAAAILVNRAAEQHTAEQQINELADEIGSSFDTIKAKYHKELDKLSDDEK